jgi:hypothetical protein
MRFYKIRNRDGLFSNGGATPKWNEEGKIWHNLNRVKDHLRVWLRYNKNRGGDIIPFHWEVVEFEVKEVEASKVKASELLKE